MGCKSLSIWVLTALMAGGLAGAVWAKDDISADVKTVLASQESEYLDPRLSSLIKELQTIFRYSCYRLLSEDRVGLTMKETGKVSLPGNRVLEITPLQIEGDRMELKLVMVKKKKEIFQTIIKLLNHRSLTVGGPKYKDGFLLFNISASF
jgi:hypothetical protein